MPTDRGHDIPIIPVVMAPTVAKAIVDALIDDELDIAVIYTV